MTEENNIQQLLRTITTCVNEDFEDFTPMNKLAAKFGTQTSNIVLPIFIGVLIISILTHSLAHFFITLFGMIYPSYMSFKVKVLKFRR